MDFKNEDNEAIGRAYQDGRYVEAFALTYWRLLDRVEKLLEAEGLGINVSGNHPNTAALLEDMRDILNAEIASRGDKCPNNLWAAGWILRSLSLIFAAYPDTGSAEETARMALLGFDLGKAESISGFVGSGRFDQAISNEVLRESQSAAGRNSSERASAWRQSGFISYAVEEERAKPAGYFSKKLSLGRATDAIAANLGADNAPTPAALSKAMERHPDQYNSLAAMVKAFVAGDAATVDPKVQPLIIAALKAAPK